MSIDLTGIRNIGEFYSHHYLEALLEDDLRGLFAGWRAAEEKAPDQRLNRCATEYFAAKSRAMQSRRLAERYHASHGLHVTLLEALGYPYTPEVRYLLTDEIVPILSAVPRDGREYLWAVETTFADPDTSPLEQTILSEQLAGVSGQKSGVGSQTSGGRSQIGNPKSQIANPSSSWEDLIGEIFRRDEPPRWLILFAGQTIYLIDRTKWGYGQYLLFDLDELFARREREALRATAALLARAALAPDDGIPLHDTLDENSHKHAYGVSQDLKYGVRRAVELLANEYVWYMRNVAHQSVLSTGDLARRLTDDSLRYLYRLLFLFYAEARAGELGIVPMRSEAYREGYSLEMLRDLEQTPLTTPQAQDGYFIHESLAKLFRLVNDGYRPDQLALREEGDDLPLLEAGFTLDGLHSELFDAASTPLLSKARFRNRVLQEVIQLLSLSRETGGRRASRGRISYAQLGINQLGAVYEGLLSYSGFFAQERLYEVKPADKKEDADETQQTYFVPERDLSRYEPAEFVYQEMPDGTRQRKFYERGAFIFRLAGRDREKSASYYTPEVLTQCVVKYSLRELLAGKTADEILRIRLCEMALGSGAFGNEGLNQLADAYLERKQVELDRRIPSDEYQAERQRVKAYLAVNNFYGVDLNPTAVELARVSLWLNVIYEGAAVPWFGPRLAVGNSLIGARRQVYRADDVKSGAYREKPPIPAPLGQPRPAGSVYHWLLPDAGMAAFDGDKVIAELAPEAVKAIKAWRKGFTAKLTADELTLLQALSDRADALWAAHLAERRRILEAARQDIPVWGQEANRKSQIANLQSALTSADRERIFATLFRPTSPYRRLKLALDYWCSLWFWPIPEAGKLPTRNEFLNEIAEIFASSGEEPDFDRPAIQFNLFPEAAAPRQASFGELRPVSADELRDAFPRLRLADEIAEGQRFHHWELAFPEVFADNGGFDLTVGNPPWIKPIWDERGVLSDFAAWIAVKNLGAAEMDQYRREILDTSTRIAAYLEEYVETAGVQAFLGSIGNYALLRGIQNNLYRCFLVRAWELVNPGGITSLVHDIGIFDDPNAGLLRRAAYPRVRYHFRFYNQLNLFPEDALGHARPYCITVFGSSLPTVSFRAMFNLYHPRTINESFAHDGLGSVPGQRTHDDDWELRGHSRRIVPIDETSLRLFAAIYEESSILGIETRLPILHATDEIRVLEKFAHQVAKLGDKPDMYLGSEMLHETNSQRKGIIRRTVDFPTRVEDWVISGPHYYVATPYAKTPRENCGSKGDYDVVDLTAIPDDYLPRTIFQPALPTHDFQRSIPDFNGKPITDYYRYCNRRRSQPNSERTLISAISPRGTSHVDATFSLAFRENRTMVWFASLSHSLGYDFFVRSLGKSDCRNEILAHLPLPSEDSVPEAAIRLMCRTLRLNCLTVHYADLWQELYDPAFARDGWAKVDPRLRPWGDLTPQWQRAVALRTPFERRQALVEIDVLAAMALDLTLDELLTIYRVQFPVLQKNERRLRFDQRGMEVPMKTVGGELAVDESHPKVAEMVPPFTPVDREGDYREAWEWFARTILPGRLD